MATGTEQITVIIHAIAEVYTEFPISIHGIIKGCPEDIPLINQYINIVRGRIRDNVTITVQNPIAGHFQTPK